MTVNSKEQDESSVIRNQPGDIGKLHKEQVALYWDFENIHAAVLEEKYGEGVYRKVFNDLQEPVVNIAAIVRYASNLGNISVNRAYANWERFGSYRFSLLEHSIDLIQLFPAGGKGKNGADIRLAIDVMQDMQTYKHIKIVVIVSGDSDYISLVQRCKQCGREVFGVGVQRASSQYLMKSCSKFKFYHTLLDDARYLLVNAIYNLLANEEKACMLKARLHPAITRLYPTFDVGNYGFSSFVEFLNECRDLLSISQGDNDQMISLSEQGFKLLQEEKTGVNSLMPN